MHEEEEGPGADDGRENDVLDFRGDAFVGGGVMLQPKIQIRKRILLIILLVPVDGKLVVAEFFEIEKCVAFLDSALQGIVNIISPNILIMLKSKAHVAVDIVFETEAFKRVLIVHDILIRRVNDSAEVEYRTRLKSNRK